MKIGIIHPDLGIGGAERLIIEICVALKSKGHDVTIFTSHHDPRHSFPESNDRSFTIISRCDWVPRSIFGRFYAFCAYFRMILLAFFILIYFRDFFQTFLCDQISVCIPILKLCSRKVVFYCHYPDLLLSVKSGLFKRYYRIPINYIEEWTTGRADIVLVNSEYTMQVFQMTFDSLSHVMSQTLYPSISFEHYIVPSHPPSNLLVLESKSFVFLSLNRFERKKNISLAIYSFSFLSPDKNSDVSISFDQWDRSVLIIAGGYDDRVQENIEYYNELVALALTLNIRDKVVFLRSISSEEKLYLLANSFALIYTPEFEHFGIVPIEAMYMKLPVIAHNSGGPKETIVHERSGILCNSGSNEFSKAMKSLIVRQERNNIKTTLGDFGRQHVLEKFSFQVFRNKIHAFICH